jgi:uncharacterized C2H2 Zn-finger protein
MFRRENKKYGHLNKKHSWSLEDEIEALNRLVKGSLFFLP